MQFADEEQDEATAAPAAPRVEISKRLIVINSASALATHVLQLSVLVWLQQYLLRRISVDEYSLFPVVAAVMVFVPLLTSALVSGLERYTVEAYARGDERRVTRITSTMLPLFCGVGVIILALGAVVVGFIDVLLRVPTGRVGEAQVMLGLLMFMAAVRVIVTPLGMGLYIRQKFVLSNAIQLGVQVLRLAILLGLLLGVSTRVVWVVVASVAADLAGVIVTQVISQRLVPALRFRASEVHWGTAREVGSFSVWSFVQQVAWAIRSGTDPLILNRLAAPLDVTCYYLGAQAFVQVNRVSSLATTPWQPALTAMHAQGDTAALRHAYLRGGRTALWSVVLLAAPLIIFRNELMTLYVGPQYLQAATVMAILLAVMPFTYGQFMVSRLATATGRPRPLAVFSLTIQVTNFVLTIVLVWVFHLGAIGAALATLVVTVALQPLWIWPLGWRLGGVTAGRWLRATVWPGLAPGLAGAVLWIGLELVVRPASWGALGACVLIGALGYAAVLVAFCMQPYEREDLKRVLRSVTSVWRGRT